jgi:haloacetate dehalogenase
MMRQMPIEGFTPHRVDVGPVTIACEIAGSGPPLLLLHGYPQTRSMWRLVAPRLANDFTVVASDLRGYGESDAPPGDARHETYAKRAMAADQVALMGRLGFARFAVAGHDRGGRVAHRMCRDSPDAVSAAAVLDIVPTKYLFDGTDMAFASAYYHWFFLSQPPDLPERMIGADPEYFLRTTLDRWSGPTFTFPDDAIAHYVAAFTPGVIHASCEDYRAAASIDLEHDATDADHVRCPLLVAWGTLGAMHRLYDVPATWRDLATSVTAVPVESGHFLAEEAPDATADALGAFFREHAK